MRSEQMPVYGSAEVHHGGSAEIWAERRRHPRWLLLIAAPLFAFAALSVLSLRTTAVSNAHFEKASVPARWIWESLVRFYDENGNPHPALPGGHPGLTNTGKNVQIGLPGPDVEFKNLDSKITNCSET